MLGVNRLDCTLAIRNFQIISGLLSNCFLMKKSVSILSYKFSKLSTLEVNYAMK